ncbi:MAG: hypothetical protein CM1200mP30_17840 [Pseudomonadota bacterium]|nr:MAG: hypothetical protein CM1200mP30_17840 [Pseudomonadota bacterium]
MHVWRGRFFRLNDHLELFFFPAWKSLECLYHKNQKELHSILSSCVKASGLREAYVEMITTRGLPEPGSRDPRTALIIFCFCNSFHLDHQTTKWSSFIVSERQRIPPESVDPE